MLPGTSVEVWCRDAYQTVGPDLVSIVEVPERWYAAANQSPKIVEPATTPLDAVRDLESKLRRDLDAVVRYRAELEGADGACWCGHRRDEHNAEGCMVKATNSYYGDCGCAGWRR